MTRPGDEVSQTVVGGIHRRTRRNSMGETALLILMDVVMLEAAFLLTYWFRFYSGIWLIPLGIPPLDIYLIAGLVVLLVFFGIFYFSGMYTNRGGRSLEDDLLGLFKGVVLGSLLVLALAFFLRTLTFSRSFFGLFFLSTFFFLTLGRILARFVLRKVVAPGRGALRTLVIGRSPMRDRLLRLTRDFPGLAMTPVGWLEVSGEGDGGSTSAGSRLLDADGRSPLGEAMPELPLLGGIAEVRRVVEAQDIDLVVLTVSFANLPVVREVSAALANLNVDVHFVPDLPALHTSRMRLREIGGIPFISVREAALGEVDRIVKRSFDLATAGLGLLLLSPLLLVLSILVKLSSPGPVLYGQFRMGRDGREFRMLKFRSMRADAEKGSGPVWTVEEDPRVTPIGRFLRRSSLDELPQLWNVVCGDMSMVGPRPERRIFVEQFMQELPRYFERHRVRSGLTGWAQVHGLRGNTSIEERTYYDLHYIENWSLGLDIKILLRTLHHVLRGENAY